MNISTMAIARSYNCLINVLSGLLVGMTPAVTFADAPPVAPVRPVIDSYFGTDVVDNYRYMEDLNNPEVRAWMKAQADHTRATLDALPGRGALLERIHALSNSDVRRGDFLRRGERYFYQVSEPGTQQPRLYYRDGLKGEEHLLIDPSALGRGTNTHLSVDYYMPSNDGRMLAYGVSSGGSEDSTLHVMEVETGKPLSEVIDRTGGSIISWRPDNRSFFYMRYLSPTTRTAASETLYNARTYLHKLGEHRDGEGDVAVFGRGVSKEVDVPEGEGTYVIASLNSNYALAVANHNMDENPSTLYVVPLSKIAGSHTPWRKVADVQDGVVDFGLHGDQLFYLSQKDASHRRLLTVSLTNPDLTRSRVVIDAGRPVLTGFAMAREGLYLREREGAVSRLLLVPYDGTTPRAVPLPFEGNLYDATADERASGVLFNMQSWVHAPALINYDPIANTSSDTGLIPQSKIDASRLESKEVFATSYDGTQVPLSIIHKKDMALDGSHPTILQGYGSYGISNESYFSKLNIAWIERGGVIAIAHVRGGGENGEDWHRAGQMRTKPNTILDFIACGQYLVDQHYTSPKMMAASGSSAGGIAVGGAFTWRPDLFGVVLDQVGISDTLRIETEPNGPPNIVEFGSTKSEDGFHSLYAMSAYAHVRDGTKYPAIIFVTGANDPRVAPWHMAKMTARVRAATSSDRPVLLRIDYDAGHGNGSTRSQHELEWADLWSFALWQMGDPAFQPLAR